VSFIRRSAMQRDDVMEMARQAGFGLRYEGRGQILSATTTTEKLEAFAKLVAMRTLEGTYNEMIDIVRKNERDACAKLCDAAHPNTLPAMLGMQIRARGEE